MGPITLFDKSFLQSLSVDEAVWFNHFFLVNVCPLFFVETLADLDKSVRDGRTPEQEVGIIADKFPDGGVPCGHHRTQCIGELVGHAVPLTGQIPIAGGRPVESSGGRAAVFEQSPEADAVLRWQQRDFLEIEHQYAATWRRQLAVLDVKQAGEIVRSLSIDIAKSKTLNQAKGLAATVFSGRKKPFELLSLALAFLAVPREWHRKILKHWINSGKPALVDHAPYTAHVMEVEVFFQIALASNLISSERASNRVDVAYLYYLPFCMMFVSSDRLHRNCAPLFLRPDQEFAWGLDLKANLGEINEYYLQLPESIRERGLHAFADAPPNIGNQLVYNLWERLLPNWKRGDREPLVETRPPPPSAAEVMKLANAPGIDTSGGGRNSGELDQVVIKHLVHRKKGSWYQIPRAAAIQDDTH